MRNTRVVVIKREVKENKKKERGGTEIERESQPDRVAICPPSYLTLRYRGINQPRRW